MSTPKRRAALSAWLADVDELLAGHHDHSLSPSSVPLPAGAEPYETTVTMASLARELGALLGRLVRDPGRWILTLGPDGRPDTAVRFCVFEDGSASAATAPDGFPDGDDRFTPGQQRELAALGWEPPAPPDRPHWSVVEPLRTPAVDGLAATALSTLREVFHLQPDDAVRLRLTSSDEREGTPASETPLVGGAHRVHVLVEPPPRPPPGTVVPAWVPTDEEWADYHRALFPGAAHPPSPFIAWKYASTGVNIARALWDCRQRARQQWESEHGDDPSGWPISHPPAVLWMPSVAIPACLACTWLESRYVRSLPAGRRARAHAVDHGADPRVVRALRIPVTERGCPDDVSPAHCSV